MNREFALLATSVAALALVLSASMVADVPDLVVIPVLAVLLAACGYQTGSLLAPSDPA